MPKNIMKRCAKNLGDPLQSGRQSRANKGGANKKNSSTIRKKPASTRNLKRSTAVNWQAGRMKSWRRGRPDFPPKVRSLFWRSLSGAAGLPPTRSRRRGGRGDHAEEKLVDAPLERVGAGVALRREHH